MPKTKSKRRGKRTRVAHNTPDSKRLDAVNLGEGWAEDRKADDLSPVCAAVVTSDPAKGSSLLSSIDEDCEAMQLSREFRKLCAPHANPTYAASIGQYMRNKFSFFGIKAPERRKLQKQFTETHREKLTHHPFLLQFVVSLWQQEERECQLYGVDLMSQFRKEVLGETQAEYEEAVACAETLITTKSWWDTVDLLASQMVGFLVSQRQEQGAALMEQWIGHQCMWLKRTALLHQLNYKADTDEARLFKFCLSVAHENEFFIRKAIGWALRQYAKTNASAVREFVKKNRDKLSDLSAREALKHC